MEHHAQPLLLHTTLAIRRPGGNERRAGRAVVSGPGNGSGLICVGTARAPAEVFIQTRAS